MGQEKQQVQGPMAPSGLEPTPIPWNQRLQAIPVWIDRIADSVFLWPAVLVILCFSIFPLLLSLYLSLARIRFVRGGIDVSFVGLANYRKLFLGSEQSHLLGVLASPSLLGWLIFVLVVVLILVFLVRYLRNSTRSTVGSILRLLLATLLTALAWLLVATLSSGGRPGTLVVTLVYVYAGIFFQYTIGLLLALLTAQQIPGRRFFRVIFLLPMMITPVGVAYMFRMLADTSKGPLMPLWRMVGLGSFSWVNDPWGARAAVMIGDIWQWTPFMFIVLLAAVEGQPTEPLEAALVDGASRWQIFRYITLPQILPVSTTLVLIRMIEAFKIVDLPNVLTNGGPGTATESLTLHAFIAWRTLDIGGSSAIAYTLMLLVTIISISYVNSIRRRVADVM
jgi:multiple sugar transport system permease protein